MMIKRRHLLGGGVAAQFGLNGAFGQSQGTDTLALGEIYRQPEEGAVHERTFMQWPADVSIYGKADDLAVVREKIALIADAISSFEPVSILVRPEQMAEAKHWVKPSVSFLPVAVDDLWARDSGPTFVRDSAGALAVLDFNFNGWGDAQAYDNDSKVASIMATKLGLPRIAASVVGEAGGVENDGAGTLLAHASSWVSPNRNTKTQDEIGRALCAGLGAEKIIWAPGLSGKDITDYHIDSLARFVGPGRVLIQLPNDIDEADPWSVAAFQTYDVLKNARDAQGRKLEIIVMPEPLDIRSLDENMVASYVNYYVCNGAVISAQFGDDKRDAQAERLLKQLYPNRKIISLNIDAIAESGGGIHCATQQQPLARSKA